MRVGSSLPRCFNAFDRFVRKVQRRVVTLVKTLKITGKTLRAVTMRSGFGEGVRRLLRRPRPGLFIVLPFRLSDLVAIYLERCDSRRQRSTEPFAAPFEERVHRTGSRQEQRFLPLMRRFSVLQMKPVAVAASSSVAIGSGT